MAHASQQANTMRLLDQLSTRLMQVQQIQSQILQDYEQGLASPSRSFPAIGDFRNKLERIQTTYGSTITASNEIKQMTRTASARVSGTVELLEEILSGNV